MNIISYENDSEIPDELRCIFCNKMDKNQKQFIDCSFMYCPTCCDQLPSRNQFNLSFLTNFMQIKCLYCGKFKLNIDLEWHQQKCIQFQQSNLMNHYELTNINEQSSLFCRNQFCNQEISFNEAHNHQMKCEWRILDCPYKRQCQWRGNKRSFKLHSQKCKKQELKFDKQILLLKKIHIEYFYEKLVTGKLQDLHHREVVYLKLKLEYLKQDSQDLEKNLK